MNEQQATRLAQAWIDAWNRHDPDAILRHYAPDVEFTSPFVSALSGEASGTICGREALSAYFRKGLQAYPDLHFELIRTLIGADGVAHRGRDHAGQVEEDRCCSCPDWMLSRCDAR